MAGPEEKLFQLKRWSNGSRRTGPPKLNSILKEEGIEPSPKRPQGTWDQFLKAQAETLWACDFFTKRAITASGIVDLYVLVFMHLETREIIFTKSTRNPNSQWVTEQAREFVKQTKTREHRPTHLVHDRDNKFSAEFKAAMKGEGIECKKRSIRDSRGCWLTIDGRLTAIKSSGREIRGLLIRFNGRRFFDFRNAVAAREFPTIVN